MKKLVLLLVLMFPLFTLTAHGDGLISEAARMHGTDTLSDLLDKETKEISGDIGADGNYDAPGALKRLWKRIFENALTALEDNGRSILSLAAIALLSSCAACFAADKTIQSYIDIAGVCVAAALVMDGVDGLVVQTADALNAMAAYSRAAIPAVFTAAVSCGSVVSAPAKYAAATIAIDILMSMARSVLIPLVYAYLALALSGGVFDNALLKSCKRLVKWVAGTLLTGFTMAFGAFISISSLVTGSADALAVKTTRTIISTALPVVGGIISDAASTVLAAASMIRNSAGALSLVAVCALCAGPFVLLGVKMLLFRMTAAACEMLPNGKMSAFIGDVAVALSMLLGLLGCCAIMLFISFTAAIRVVT